MFILTFLSLFLSYFAFLDLLRFPFYFLYRFGNYTLFAVTLDVRVVCSKPAFSDHLGHPPGCLSSCFVSILVSIALCVCLYIFTYNCHFFRMIFFTGFFHEDLRNETREMDFGVSLQVKTGPRVGASVVCRPWPSLRRPTTLAPRCGSRCLPDTFSGLRRSARLCPQDAEAACRQGKDTTPFIQGQFGKMELFYP